MTREETVNLVRMIMSAFPNWKPTDLTDTVNTWHLFLEEYPTQAIIGSLKIYIQTDKSGFAPSIQQLIGGIFAPKENSVLTEGEAWALVRNAIRDGNYHSEERFAELPELIQRAVGGASMIRQWAMTDSSEVNTVIASNFQRTYKAIVSKTQYEQRVPDNLAKLVSSTAERLTIGVNGNG